MLGMLYLNSIAEVSKINWGTILETNKHNIKPGQFFCRVIAVTCYFILFIANGKHEAVLLSCWCHLTYGTNISHIKGNIIICSYARRYCKWASASVRCSYYS